MKFYNQIIMLFLIPCFFIQSNTNSLLYKEEVETKHVSKKTVETSIVEETKKSKQNIVINGCLGCYSKNKVTYQQVRRDLIKMIRLYKRAWWSEKNLNEVTQVLVFANNHPAYKIDYKLLLAIFGQESWMMIKPPLRKNRNGTVDYGLGQHNSKYYYNRFKKAVIIEKRFDIVKNRQATLYKYDPVTSTIASMIYFKTLRNGIKKTATIYKRNFYRKDLILAYNVGLTGWKRGKGRNAYYYKVMKNFKYISD